MIIYREGDEPGEFQETEHGVMCSLNGFLIVPLEKFSHGLSPLVDEIKQRLEAEGKAPWVTSGSSTPPSE